MKSLIVLLAIAMASTVWAETSTTTTPDGGEPEYSGLSWGDGTHKCPIIGTLPPEKVDPDNCINCHTVPNFKLKKASPDETYALPHYMELRYKDGKMDHAYYLCDDVEPDEIDKVFSILDRHTELPRKVIIDVHNPGGHAFNGWKIVNRILSKWDEYEIETHLDGMAFSAGFMIFNAGEKRICSPTAELMWHEAAYFEFLSKVSASDTKDKNEMMDHMQRNADDWLASRSRMSREDINNRITENRIGWWFNGREAYGFGFCDELVGSAVAAEIDY